MIRAGTHADLAAVTEMLTAAGLPTVGLDDALLVVATQAGRVVGAAAVEHHGTRGLLRSVVVEKAARGERIGAALVDETVRIAARSSMSELWLITEDAGSYFRSHGFEAGGDLPVSLRLSEEYTAHCTDSAEVLVRSIGGEAMGAS